MARGLMFYISRHVKRSSLQLAHQEGMPDEAKSIVIYHHVLVATNYNIAENVRLTMYVF